MVESKSLKLKLGLCGLALTSFLALNARGNTVHADTVSGNNADAITWDSDNDDSQVVKEDSNQEEPSQSVQTQAPAVQKQQVAQSSQPKQSAVQSAPVQNKAVQPAQKQATVQSNVQVKQSQPKVAVANVSSTQAVQNRAETSAVRQSNVQTSTVNRLTADDHQVKVARVDATTSNKPVTITNPADDTVKVHFVDSNGKAVSGVNDVSINVFKSGTGKYTVPSGYQLVNPNGTYTITSDKHVIHHDEIPGHYVDSQYQDGWDWYNDNGESGWSPTDDEVMGGVQTHYSQHMVPEKVWVDTISAWDETVGNATFTDNSGNVKSVTGNVVNVAVTKPQSVDPNSAQCKKQATRVIHIAFPNGVKPESYDSITDSAGNKLTIDSNNNLTQTVTFTRSETVDSLTGTTLTQTPWQQQGAINAVTLPDIPGYTMVTTN